ncbi:enoyl-CoA hydratase/isomerase family protein [Blastococcus sp. SYSU D00669]
MEPATIECEVDGPAGIIRLARPAKHNALSAQLIGEVVDALARLDADPAVRGIVLTGSDTAFSTGADLNEALQVDSAAKFVHHGRMFRELTHRMERSLTPIVAAISGHCYTGGLEIAMAADIRYAAEGARFAMTSARIGSVAGIGGTQRLPRLVGRSVALELMFTARTFDAAYAERIGLVSRVVPDGTVVEAAKALVAEFAVNAPLSIGWTKQAVRTGMDVDLESALDLEAVLSGSAAGTRDKTEGMSAFLEKRPAVFAGE